MSVQELESRLAQVSIDIERQKEVLKGLEYDKSLIQRQLNSLRDPVARLPLELSSDIFLRCLGRKPQVGERYLPVLLLNICTAWTNIAVSVPALWHRIEIRFPRHKSFDKALEKWLQRAGGRPLHISLHGTIDPEVTACIWRYSASIKQLDIFFEDEEVPEDGIHHLLGGTMPKAPLPCLQNIHIRGAYDLVCHRSPLSELVRWAPNLVDLRLENASFIGTESFDEHFVLRNLRHLTCTGKDLMGSTSCSLSAPNLETLALSPSIFDDSEPDAIISFLQRSLPPLRELKVFFRHRAGDDDFSWFESCMPMATLSHLELDSPTRPILNQLFAILQQPPSSVLPAFQSLIVRVVDRDVFAARPNHLQTNWKGLARALTIRRSKLRTVRFHSEARGEGFFESRIVLRDGETLVPPDILALFTGFLDHGTDIYFGTEEFGENLLLPPS
ncbi:hypothetical protein FB45DRAFT_4438 [Roridomyces roridus]|uniref:F-box domain-containing protein n=1 Tax=Roridomyces roridus TaxID=1738132 RepID=A0AAD7CIJ7_9AGAR|nr:hypothetical protein FB45DRAFT_4438 [Roridomyces roridus]